MQIEVYNPSPFDRMQTPSHNVVNPELQHGGPVIDDEGVGRTLNV